MLKRVSIPSPNYSSRGGTGVRLIVLHTAEGALTYQSLGNYFASSSSGVSSHTGIDDTPNTVGEYVGRGQKAWTQGNANPYSVAAELCAFAAWTPADWAAHPQMLANAAAWVAEEAQAFGIPLVCLSTAQAQDGRSRGVCQHVDLGAAGGGHWDCGPGFPLADVVAAAAGGTQPQEDDMTDEQAQMLESIYNGLGVGNLKPRWDGPTWLYHQLTEVPCGVLTPEQDNVLRSIWNALAFGNLAPYLDQTSWLVDQLKSIDDRLAALEGDLP
jgi:hypothetical protein